MKRLFVWLASVSICAAQAVSIGPFATEDWVDERLQVLTNDFATIPYVDDAVGEVEDKIPDVSVYATKSYVNAVSNAIPDVSGFATKSYVDAVSNTIPDISGLATVEYVDAVSNAIPDTSAFSTVEYVNTTSNNLALLIDDLVSEEELGSSVSNIVPAWALVPIPPVTAEVDPAFTNWLATTNVVIDDNVGTFVSNVVPSWALVPIPPVTVEVDPAFTNWLATTNSATVQYVDDHKWDWFTQVTNAPGFVKKSGDIMTGNLTMYEPQNGATIYFPSESNGKLSFGSGLFDVNDDTGHVTIHGNEVATVEDLDGFAPESIQLPPYETAATLRYEYNGSRTFYYNGTNSTVGLFMVDNKGDPYISACNGQSAKYVHPVFFDSKDEALEDIYGTNVRIDTATFLPTYFVDGSDRLLLLTTNGVLKAGTAATVEDLAGFINSDSDSVTIGRRYAPYPVGHRSICIGYSTNETSSATALLSTAIGQSVGAHGDYSYARGRNIATYSEYSTAIGHELTISNSPVAFLVGESGNITDSPGAVALGTRVGLQNAANSMLFGYESNINAPFSVAFGRHITVNDPESFVFGFGNAGSSSHGTGTFNINPTGGLAGVWIGETNLAIHLDNSSKIALDAIAPAFSASNVYTNGDYVIYDRHLYECTNYTGTAGWRAGDWQQTTVTGILGNLRRLLDAINGETL